jgi:general stress protein 26
VQLAFEGNDKLYITVTGKAELIREKAQFDKHWVPDLEQWFAQGTDTPGMVLLCVTAKKAKYWQDMTMGEWRA